MTFFLLARIEYSDFFFNWHIWLIFGERSDRNKRIGRYWSYWLLLLSVFRTRVVHHDKIQFGKYSRIVVGIELGLHSSHFPLEITPNQIWICLFLISTSILSTFSHSHTENCFFQRDCLDQLVSQLSQC